MRRVLVAITGASGALYGVRLCNVLLAQGLEVTLVVSDAGRQVVHHETGLVAADLENLGDGAVGRFVTYRNDDLAAPPASGSAAPDAMVVCPCSMGTAARIAAGISSTLLERCADVMLKEKRPLVLVPRETPLSRIHLRNLLSLAEAGADILPAMPAFYHDPKTVGEMVDFVVGKVLERLRVCHDLYRRWDGGAA